MYIALLGRQSMLSLAELERVFGAAAVTPFSAQAALVDTPHLEVQRLGGTIKAGKVVLRLRGDWRTAQNKIFVHYRQAWAGLERKQTLGISVYGLPVKPRDVQNLGLKLKRELRKSGTSLRLIPNADAALSSAVSHHNKLGLSPNKTELLIIAGRDGQLLVAESTGAQNITALAARDQGRPKRDAFVGMLPPKLALMMVNMAAGTTDKRVASGGAAPASDKISDFSEEGADRTTGPAGSDLRGNSERIGDDGNGVDSPIPTLLDPFCGTGVLLQEAALLGLHVYGTDLSEKMIHYSQDNLNWLQTSHRTHFNWQLHQGDAMTTTWRQPIHAIATEAYLGQPFSAPPSPAKLAEVRGNCNHIITEFLRNLAPQLQKGTPLCLAVPAWRDTSGHFTHLPLVQKLSSLGYRQIALRNVSPSDLLYYREDQVVARELLLLEKRS